MGLASVCRAHQAKPLSAFVGALEISPVSAIIMNTFLTQAGYVISSKSVVLTQSFAPFEAVSHLSATVHSFSFYEAFLRQAATFLASFVLYAFFLCAFDRGVQKLTLVSLSRRQTLVKRSTFLLFYLFITQRQSP